MSPTSQKPVPLALAFENQEVQFARAFTILRQAIADRAFPGASLAVTHQGSLVASQGFGRFTYDDDAPVVQPDTVFDLASLTKVVATTTIAMLLYERGQLSLDAPLSTFLPEFVSLAPKHQQAMREWPSPPHADGALQRSAVLYEKLFEFAQSREDLIHAALTARLPPLAHAPFTATSGLSCWEKFWPNKLTLVRSIYFARQEIFAPLGMTRTRFLPPDDWKTKRFLQTEDDRYPKRIVQGEVNDENAYA